MLQRHRSPRRRYGTRLELGAGIALLACLILVAGGGLSTGSAMAANPLRQ